jgi:hypothetical protein
MFSLVSFHVQHCCKSSRRPAFQEASLIPDKTAVILLHCQPGGEEKENGTTRELEKVFHRLPERPSSPPQSVPCGHLSCALCSVIRLLEGSLS